MSETLRAIQALAASGSVRVSEHGYDELSEDDIKIRDVLEGLSSGALVEDYPSFPKGPAVLVLEFDGDNKPIHVVWGIPKGFVSPAVLITAYRPDPKRWNDDFKTRRP